MANMLKHPGVYVFWSFCFVSFWKSVKAHCLSFRIDSIQSESIQWSL